MQSRPWRVATFARAVCLSTVVALGSRASIVHGQITLRTDSTSTRFVAVAVHGDALAEARVITTDSVPPCLWGFTYNTYSQPDSRPAFPRTKHVTLSFVTPQEWSMLKAGNPHVAAFDVINAARFHTRIYLAPPGHRPYLEYRKSTSGSFVGRGQLDRVVEPYLAALHIPTWINVRGEPETARFRQLELDSIRGVHRAHPDTFRPACGRI